MSQDTPLSTPAEVSATTTKQPPVSTNTPASPASKIAFYSFLAALIIFLPFGSIMSKAFEKDRVSQYEMVTNNYFGGSSTHSSAPVPGSDPSPYNTPPEYPKPLPVPPTEESTFYTQPAPAPAFESLDENQLAFREKMNGVKMTLEYHVSLAQECRKMGLTITGGGWDSPICAPIFNGWGSYFACGLDPNDMSFTVLNGNSDDWDFTVNCKNFPLCNGPENALCNKNGCTFAGTCQ